MKNRFRAELYAFRMLRIANVIHHLSSVPDDGYGTWIKDANFQRLKRLGISRSVDERITCEH